MTYTAADVRMIEHNQAVEKWVRKMIAEEDAKIFKIICEAIDESEPESKPDVH